MALDKARKLRARTIGGRPGTAIATAADTADSDAASDLTVDGGPTVTDSTAPDGADVASELLSLNCACKVLREMGEQPLYTARIKDDEIGSSFQHLNEGMAEDEHTLELSRDSAIARGPWAIAEAVESITKETLKRTNVETGLYPEAVICWKR